MSWQLQDPHRALTALTRSREGYCERVHLCACRSSPYHDAVTREPATATEGQALGLQGHEKIRHNAIYEQGRRKGHAYQGEEASAPRMNSHQKAGLLLSPPVFSNSSSGIFGVRLITEEKKFVTSNYGRRVAVLETGSGSET